MTEFGTNALAVLMFLVGYTICLLVWKERDIRAVVEDGRVIVRKTVWWRNPTFWIGGAFGLALMAFGVMIWMA